MEIVGFICIGLATLISMFYGIILLIAAFKKSVLWGLGYLFVPFVSLIFIIMHWDETKSPFLKGLIAIPLIIIGVLLIPQDFRIEQGL